MGGGNILGYSGKLLVLVSIFGLLFEFVDSGGHNVSEVCGEGSRASCIKHSINAMGENEGPAPQAEGPSPSQEPVASDFEDIKLFLLYPVIQSFKKSITSDPFNITGTWVGPDICGKYRGFFCDNPPNNLSAKTVSSIDFNGFQLGAPSVTEFIEQFVDLALFHANSNRFGGTISPGIANLPFLYELDVSNNLLAGAFPTAVFGIAQLSFLDIRFNSFSGTVPKQLFALLNAEVVFINNNNFMQRLPETLGSSTVSYLALANNKFTGTIPRSICNASRSLIEVLLLNNELYGCLPYEVGFLGRATVFDVGNNRLTGPIPYSFGCLGRVEQLVLAGNSLYGRVPEVVCALGNLLNLSLSDNYFTSMGPICRSLAKSGVLDDRNNCIPGRPSQRPVEECVEFLLKKTICPSIASYYYIPCKITHLDADPSSSTESRTYSALAGTRPLSPKMD
ncbi:hypothetical protein H6P81_020663 [Aristolochia fimbriata]|uniref:EGF-like domain-containing protein n=1 Tax=Aristolochia fimbriata TaxID=158543 RepID=A0AAV7DV82_ARIFI|nr:hypothetical protein H6P81_020663 [Aristolochia fimbriata]